MSLFRRTLAGSLLALSIAPLLAQEAGLDPTFNVTDEGYGIGDGTSNGNSSSIIYSIARQSDGKILIGGAFTDYNATSLTRFGRLNEDGTLDVTYEPTGGPNASIYAIAVQPDGKAILAGAFTTFRTTTRNYIARANTDGTLDVSFAPSSGANGVIRAVAIQPDGKILIGGEFTTFNGIACNRLARLNANGSLDATFNGWTGANNTIRTITVQADAKILIGGDFNSVNGTAKTRITRLTASGALDASFMQVGGCNNTVYTIAIQTDGRIMVGGLFSQCSNTTRYGIARLESSGLLDPAYPAGTLQNSSVRCILLLADDKALVAGSFLNWGGTGRQHLVRLDTSGAVDPSFISNSNSAGFSDQPYSMFLKPDGRCVMAGYLPIYLGANTGHIHQLNVDGSRDASFNCCGSFNNSAGRIVRQNDGKLLVAGGFTAYQAMHRSGIIRILDDGTIDPSFQIGKGADYYGVNDLVVQPDNKIMIAGRFFTFGGAARKSIARLNENGSVDSTFNPGTGFGMTNGVPDDYGYVNAIALQPDGRIIAVGTFEKYNGVTTNQMVRLLANGALDASFTNGAGYGTLWDVRLLPNGKFLVADGTIRRFNSNGTLDPTFSYTSTTYVSKIHLTDDGKIYAMGSNSHLDRLNPDGSIDQSFLPGASTQGNLSAVEELPDGKLLVCGSFSSWNGVPRQGIVRLAHSGEVDLSFDPGTGAASVLQTHTLPSGKIMIVGSFTSYNGTGRNRITRLNGTSRTNIRVMLEGPYSGTTMTDALRTLPSFPLTEPFTALGYAHPTFTAGTTIQSSILSTTGNNAIVDWVLVEMRPAISPGTVAASRALLLQRDGDVVDLDGVSTVGFAGLADGNYCVAVRSRNHLPVISSPSTPIAYGGAVANIDFTLPATLVYDADARKNVSGVMVLAAGDVTFNGTVKYTGTGNDRDPILTRIGGVVPTNTVGGYWCEDVNMDGVVKYTGASNDRDLILQSIGGVVPTNTRVASLP